jgi:hypothetical protein
MQQLQSIKQETSGILKVFPNFRCSIATTRWVSFRDREPVGGTDLGNFSVP